MASSSICRTIATRRAFSSSSSSSSGSGSVGVGGNRSSSKVVERVRARVFTHTPYEYNNDDDEEEDGANNNGTTATTTLLGGNPLTIFSSNFPLKSSIQKRLAKSCDWESVMIEYRQQQQQQQQQHQEKEQEPVINNIIKKKKNPKLSFYMPSGERVSFCAHAAMGAALEICLSTLGDDEDRVEFSVDMFKNDDDTSSFSEKKDEEEQQQLLQEEEEQDYQTTIYDGDIVALEMKNVTYEQNRITQTRMPMLARLLRDSCNLGVRDLASTPPDHEETKSNSHTFEDLYKLGGTYPILCHASIARPKTLIPVRDVSLLHGSTAPPSTTSIVEEKEEGASSSSTSSSSSSSSLFARSCKALDDTTGLYLYAKSQEEDGAWECRQYPRSSGYSEDPATGIAAAALACYLYSQHEIELPAYKFYQGTAMKKPSLIVVDELKMKMKMNNNNKSTTPNHNNDDEEGDVDQEDEEEGKMEASFRLLGRVEIDERDSIEVDDI